jgi:hypothetical protein
MQTNKQTNKQTKAERRLRKKGPTPSRPPKPPHLEEGLELITRPRPVAEEDEEAARPRVDTQEIALVGVDLSQQEVQVGGRGPQVADACAHHGLVPPEPGEEGLPDPFFHCGVVRGQERHGVVGAGVGGGGVGVLDEVGHDQRGALRV